MTPDTQQKCLTRFLKLQPLVGWPEYQCDHARRQLRLSRAALGDRIVTAWTQLTDGAWTDDDTSVCNHEALCIIQAHLLSKLGEYSKGYNELVQIHMAMGEVATPGVSIYWCDGSGRRGEVIHHAPTMIEALLDFFERIQSKGDNDA